MKINWKVRLKNPVFWLTVLPALAAFTYTVLGACDIVPAVSENDIINIITSIVTALTTLGVLVDPTTEGVSDSIQAMSYEKPKEDAEEC